MSLSAIVKAHGEDRLRRRWEVERQVSAVLAAADDLDNDARTLLGLELASVASNGKHLEGAMKKYVKQVAELTRVSAGYVTGFDTLATAVAGLGHVAVWLEQTEAALASIHANFAAIEKGLS